VGGGIKETQRRSGKALNLFREESTKEARESLVGEKRGKGLNRRKRKDTRNRRFNEKRRMLRGGGWWGVGGGG